MKIDIHSDRTRRNLQRLQENLEASNLLQALLAGREAFNQLMIAEAEIERLQSELAKANAKL